MRKRSEVVVEQLGKLREDLRDLWVALRADPKKQARKEQAWSIFAGALGAAATMLARRATSKTWGVLTGEQPPRPQPTRTSRRPSRPRA
jgi:hypothetical protein